MTDENTGKKKRTVPVVASDPEYWDQWDTTDPRTRPYWEFDHWELIELLQGLQLKLAEAGYVHRRVQKQARLAQQWLTQGADIWQEVEAAAAAEGGFPAHPPEAWLEPELPDDIQERVEEFRCLGQEILTTAAACLAREMDVREFCFAVSNTVRVFGSIQDQLDRLHKMADPRGLMYNRL